MHPAVALTVVTAVLTASACGSDPSGDLVPERVVDVDIEVDRLVVTVESGEDRGVRQLTAADVDGLGVDSASTTGEVVLAVSEIGSSSCPPASLVGFDRADGALAIVRDGASIDPDQVCSADVVTWTVAVTVACGDVAGLTLPDGSPIDVSNCPN